jgi:hypothetical protein
MEKLRETDAATHLATPTLPAYPAERRLSRGSDDLSLEPAVTPKKSKKRSLINDTIEDGLGMDYEIDFWNAQESVHTTPAIVLPPTSPLLGSPALNNSIVQTLEVDNYGISLLNLGTAGQPKEGPLPLPATPKLKLKKKVGRSLRRRTAAAYTPATAPKLLERADFTGPATPVVPKNRRQTFGGCGVLRPLDLMNRAGAKDVPLQKYSPKRFLSFDSRMKLSLNTLVHTYTLPDGLAATPAIIQDDELDMFGDPSALMNTPDIQATPVIRKIKRRKKVNKENNSLVKMSEPFSATQKLSANSTPFSATQKLSANSANSVVAGDCAIILDDHAPETPIIDEDKSAVEFESVSDSFSRPLFIKPVQLIANGARSPGESQTSYRQAESQLSVDLIEQAQLHPDYVSPTNSQLPPSDKHSVPLWESSKESQRNMEGRDAYSDLIFVPSQELASPQLAGQILPDTAGTIQDSPSKPSREFRFTVSSNSQRFHSAEYNITGASTPLDLNVRSLSSDQDCIIYEPDGYPPSIDYLAVGQTLSQQSVGSSPALHLNSVAERSLFLVQHEASCDHDLAEEQEAAEGVAPPLVVEDLTPGLTEKHAMLHETNDSQDIDEDMEINVFLPSQRPPTFYDELLITYSPQVFAETENNIVELDTEQADMEITRTGSNDESMLSQNLVAEDRIEASQRSEYHDDFINTQILANINMTQNEYDDPDFSTQILAGLQMPAYPQQSVTGFKTAAGIPLMPSKESIELTSNLMKESFDASACTNGTAMLREQISDRGCVYRPFILRDATMGLSNLPPNLKVKGLALNFKSVIPKPPSKRIIHSDQVTPFSEANEKYNDSDSIARKGTVKEVQLRPEKFNCITLCDRGTFGALKPAEDSELAVASLDVEARTMNQETFTSGFTTAAGSKIPPLSSNALLKAAEITSAFQEGTSGPQMYPITKERCLTERETFTSGFTTAAGSNLPPPSSTAMLRAAEIEPTWQEVTSGAQVDAVAFERSGQEAFTSGFTTAAGSKLPPPSSTAMLRAAEIEPTWQEVTSGAQVDAVAFKRSGQEAFTSGFTTAAGGKLPPLSSKAILRAADISSTVHDNTSYSGQEAFASGFTTAAGTSLAFPSSESLIRTTEMMAIAEATVSEPSETGKYFSARFSTAAGSKLNTPSVRSRSKAMVLMDEVDMASIPSAGFATAAGSKLNTPSAQFRSKAMVVMDEVNMASIPLARHAGASEEIHNYEINPDKDHKAGPLLELKHLNVETPAGKLISTSHPARLHSKMVTRLGLQSPATPVNQRRLSRSLTNSGALINSPLSLATPRNSPFRKPSVIHPAARDSLLNRAATPIKVPTQKIRPAFVSPEGTLINRRFGGCVS